MNETFELVARSLTDEKLKRTASSLFLKYKPTLANELERASRFAFDLYFKEMAEASLKVCEVLEKETFNGNHNLWTWIQSALLLKCWIFETLTLQNHDEEIKKTLSTINATLDFGTDEMKKRISLKARNRRLNGSLLHYEEIEKAINNSDKAGELEWRITQFKELLYIYFLGGSETIPKEKALKELEDNGMLIRQLI